MGLPMGEIPATEAPADTRLIHRILSKDPGTTMRVLAIPKPDPADRTKVLVTYRKTFLLKMTPDPWRIPSLRIPIQLETEMGPTGGWTEFRVRLLGSQSTMDLATIQSMLTNQELEDLHGKLKTLSSPTKS
jgi:hypothetical protein